MIKAFTSNLEVLKEHLNSILSQFPQISHSKILIKPNLGGRYPIMQSENNDSVFMNILCKALIELNAQEILIMHSSLIGFGYSKFCTFEDLIKINNYDSLKNLGGVKFINLDEVDRTNTSLNGFNFSIPSILKEKDIFHINLCKMKTHMETIVSLALKNQMGLVSLENRKSMHKNCLQTQIAYLSQIIKPAINIIDGITSMEGNGPHHGIDKKTNLLIAGDNLVEIDSLACYLMGINYEEVSHINTANKLGIGPFINKTMKEKHKNKKKHFKKAEKVYRIGNKLSVWPTTACSGCIFSLSKAIDELTKLNSPKSQNNFPTEKTNIYIGQCKNLKIKDNQGTYALGNCCQDMSKRCNIKNNLKGCPPAIIDIIKLLSK